jgi:murein DD-endopeptidase MepM/ murein hydrolase activator NlpD
MALSDYIERMQQISGVGPRATDYTILENQRAKAKADMLQQLKQAQARAVQFNPVADQGEAQSSGGDQTGTFGGRLSMYPLKGNLRVTSPYGVNREGHKSAHTGIDWGAGSGTPIYAPGDATVRSALFNKIYGNQTILDLGGGYSTMFGHQSGFASGLKPGSKVKAGQIIGYVGSTGWSTGPHLHFETWFNNKPVNPLSWFR